MESHKSKPKHSSIYIKLGILILLSATCAFFACSKGKASASEVKNFALSKEGLAYIQLPVGKYFIYKDSATGTLDSTVVTQSLLKSFQDQVLDLPFTGEQFTLILSKVEPSGTNSDWLSGTASSYYAITNIYMTPLNHSGGYLFRYPPCNCGSESIRSSIVERSISSMVVEGKMYSDVVLLTNVGNPSQFNYPTSSYYWAKGVGLIKTTKSDTLSTKTYTLLRSN